MPAELFSSEFFFFLALGFLAQLVDGALGMAYGLIATTVLLSWGTAPAFASAGMHAAEVVTTGLAGGFGCLAQEHRLGAVRD